MDATLALAEPGRSTILLRFFEGLPPREIAARQRVPVETVRSRVRRALAEIRKTLDRRAGDRSAWAVALLPLAGPALPGAAPPGELPIDGPAPAAPTAGLFAVAAAVVIVAVGGAAGWIAAATRRPATTATELRDAIGDERARTREFEQVTSRTAARTRARDAANAPRADAAGGTPRGAPAIAARAVPGADAAAPTTDAPTPFPAYRAALAGEDWGAAGRAFAALIRSVRPIAEAAAADRQPSPEEIGTLQARSGPVAALALRLQARGVPGAIPNLVLAHPAVLTNLLPPTLAALGEPLTAEQRTRLMRAAWDGVSAVDSAHDTLGDDEILLRRMAVEAAALGPWLAAVNDVLTQRQRAVLRPERFRGRAGVDLVSPGFLWPALPPRVEARAAEEYVRKVESLLLAPQFPAGTRARDNARDILDTWAAALPAGAFAGTRSPLDASGFAHAERLAFWAAQTADLLEALRDGAAETRRQREALTRRLILLMPFLPAQLNGDPPR